MSGQLQVDEATLCTVTVTFNPDIELLQSQLRALPSMCSKIIVDNNSSADLFEQIQLLADHTPNIYFMRNDSNIGLAAAINRGVELASKLTQSPKFVLLLDQDSEPQPGSIETLLAAFRTIEQRGEKVGCVGPLLLDVQTGLTHGFHQCTRWRWKRVYPPADSTAPLPCANLNGSGTLVRIELFQRLGGLDEPLFIDHVDTEWAFRVLAHGYGLWGIPGAVFKHNMGQASVRFWFCGWRVWPFRSPQRHYYLFRNAISLMHRPYVPAVWKTWAAAKLALTAAVHGFHGARSGEQLHEMWQGTRAAFDRRNRGVLWRRNQPLM